MTGLKPYGLKILLRGGHRQLTKATTLAIVIQNELKVRTIYFQKFDLHKLSSSFYVISNVFLAYSWTNLIPRAQPTGFHPKGSLKDAKTRLTNTNMSTRSRTLGILVLFYKENAGKKFFTSNQRRKNLKDIILAQVFLTIF